MRSSRCNKYPCARVKTIRAAHRRFPVLWQSPMLDAGTGQFPASPILWTVVGIALGVSPSLAQTYHMGALRSWSAISEVQTLLNPMSVLVIVPTHLSMGGGRGVSPGSPGQWTVVGIPWGVGTGEGARPLPAQGGLGAEEPPSRQSRDVFVENSGEIIHYEPSVLVS